MRRLITLALFGILAGLPAHAGLVQIEITGTVDFNQVRPPTSFSRDVVHSGDPVTVSFQVDSTNFVNSSSYPTRGYVVIPGSYSLRFDTATGPVVVPFPSPYPFGGTPFFVVRNNDPHVDGFFVSTDSVDYPFDYLWVDEVGRLAPYFQQTLELSYPEDRLPSLDIYDAAGTYDYDGLSTFYFSMLDGFADAMYLNYTQMTISRVPVAVPVDFKPGGCPNPLNMASQGVLPFAVLGTDTLDVANIDPASIRLNGVPALQSSIEDVGSPFYPFTGKTDCSLDCNDSNPDGIADLMMKFDTQAVAATLGDIGDGACAVVHLTGNFRTDYDAGGPIAGEDVALILNKGASPLPAPGADRLTTPTLDRHLGSKTGGSSTTFQLK
jgi:hypothetical protein